MRSIRSRRLLLRTPLVFGQVEGSAERVLIVATGPSIAGLVLNRQDFPGVHIIAVKQAIHCVNAHSWITVDPNIRARAMMKNQREGTKYYAAVPDDYGMPNARLLHHRVTVDPNVIYLHRTVGTGPLKAKYGLSEDRGALHTGNSAWGALGIAYLMGAQKIGFLGLDGSQLPHGVGEGAPRGSLAHLPQLFASALPQLSARGVEVLNGSPQSTIKCFYRVSPQAVLNWIRT